ncbi:MAG TPA: YbfB/YjiJ family MFS transporter, partial [Burkholderiaceae bacterium]|nr:YbfB/YjiJ family MFS transporter [Burkholderiaceae bacterium]
CLTQLARRDAAALGGAMYAGPGAGIVVSGLFASGMVQWGWRAAAGWAIFGVLAFVLAALVWRIFGTAATPQPAPGARAAAASNGAIDIAQGRAELGCLALAYGIAGFGYIVTATFVPVIARAALPGSPWLDMFWPIFGLGVIAGALLSTRFEVSGDLRLLLAGSYLVQAAGIFTSVWSPSLAGFAIGSLLLGLPFTAITFFAMQEVRRLRPALAASFMGLLTATYGIGQIVGPPLVAWLLQRSASAGAGFALSLEIAASALVVGAGLYLGMVKAYPMQRARVTLPRA